LALPGVSVERLAEQRRPEVAVVEANQTTDPAPGMGDLGGLLSGDAQAYLFPLTQGNPGAAPWEAGMVEADGMPLPTAPPPGPVPVDGIPLPAVAAPASPSTGPPPAATSNPGPGESVRSVPNQSAPSSAGP